MANGTVGVAPGTTTLTLPNGQTIAVSDWIDDKLYSTVQLVNGQTSPVEAFTAGRSQPIPGGQRASTRVDTNVPRNGDSGLPQSWEMYVYGIGILLVRVERPPAGQTQPILADGVGASLSNVPTLTTLFNIDRVTYLEFTYNQKVYTYGVMQDYPQGHGYYVFSTNSAFELAQNGVPSPRDRNAWVLPIDLRENLGFKMSFSPEAPIVINQPANDGGAALTFADAKVYLYGLIKRSVV
jgi:hypothetical protein